MTPGACPIPATCKISPNGTPLDGCAYPTDEEIARGGNRYRMKQHECRRLIGLCTVCFGAGVVLSFLLSKACIALLVAVVLVGAGLLLVR